MDQKTSIVEQRVYYADTDHGGVAYYASYLRWFEIGRTELLRGLGIEQRELDEQGIMLPVIEVKCEYKSPALYDDVILIASSLSKIGDKSITFSYNISRKEDNRLLAHGHTVNVFAKGASSVGIPPGIRAKLER